MKELDLRPLGTFAASLYVFSCILFVTDRSVRTAALVLLSVFLVFYTVAVFLKNREFKYVKAVTATIAGALAAAVFSGYFMDVRLVRTESLAGGKYDFYGVVTEVKYTTSYDGQYTVKADDSLDEIGGMKFSFHANDGGLRVGDMIRCTAEISVLDNNEWKMGLVSDKVYLSMECVEEVEICGKGGGISVALSRLRSHLSASLLSEMSSESGGFAAALILGDKTGLSDSISRDFGTLGISHLLALSGTHLSALVSSISLFLPSVDRRRFFKFAVLCPTVIFYIALTGFSSSVVRSGIMLIISYGGTALYKKADLFTSLSVSAVMICLVNPYAPLDVGLQLSFASVAGLLVSGEVRQKFGENKKSHPAVRSIVESIITATVVPVVVLPLMWLRFGEVSLVSPLTNLLFIPAVSLMIPILGLLVITSFVPTLFIPFANAADAAISAFLGAVERMAEAFDPILPINGRITSAVTVIFTVILLAAVLSTERLQRFFTFGVILCLLVLIISAQIFVNTAHSGLTVCYSSSGTDDGICVFSDGYTLLIDSARYPASSDSAAELGAQMGSGRIDAFMLTHLHESHRLTLSEVCGNYYVDSLWIPVCSDKEAQGIADSLRSEAESLGIEVFSYLPGEKLSFGDIKLFAPVAEYTDGSSHPVISFSLEYDGQRLIYNGSGSNNTDFADGDIRILGSHGPEPKGVLCIPDFDCTNIVSPGVAGRLDALPNGNIVADRAVIKLRSGAMPVIETYREE